MNAYPHATPENFGTSAVKRSATLGGDDDWMSVLSKLSPVLSGVSAFGGLINSVISARQTAAFQEQLINALQGIETTLEGIKNDLDAIYQELKNVEQDIEGLGLNDKLTAITSWGMEMAALTPSDTRGAQTLATAMLDASQGASNLIGCMTGLHNAMVGEAIGTPLITLVDPASFLRLRARLVQGLQLLAFAVAFNTDEQYDYSVFLLQWAGNFQQQLELYLATGKDTVLGALPGLYGSDGVVILRYAQPSLPSVALLFEGTGQTMQLCSGALNWVTREGDSFIGFPGGKTFSVDFLHNQFTSDYNTPLAQACNPDIVSQYAIVDAGECDGNHEAVVGARGSLVCGARYHPEQIFLGTVNGQMHWLESTGDRSSIQCAIHDGGDTSAGLLTFDAVTGNVTSVPFTALRGISPSLWTVSWMLPGTFAIEAHSSTESNPRFLTIDASGRWQVGAEMGSFTVKATAPAAKQPTSNPFLMKPSPVTMQSYTGSSKLVLLHQL